ncbi:uncharacterized protein BO72DRAFT_515847 [Aspergillus fijiensis CBS 313.89]|uniref:WSC domain-containing protein n=1 Tax=Aspergillus fijiensis CBS 313.89 TaxID=1448319 RepID=A0A8G1RKL4_9EURO|nr:uncharacterized protein BO72DRAFT_515847 [Aspergillus fijiensis CBS 313.89]RAK74413.1 hypothetical protein BO72DRAFT_515847 [Aspergillus fijiensis CBS 313.89]
MTVGRTVAWLYALGLVASSAAGPLRSPLSAPKIVRRATSSADPSCPDGFFCQQSDCPSDVVCPSGETCINFEGNYACAPPGLQWCALNPTTLQGVGCDSGLCCHGNCYTSDAVCCDFPSIQCSIGTACNVCSPGQTCGSNQCVGGAESTTTTTTKTTSSSTTTSLPPVVPSSTTTTSTATKSTTSTTTTTSKSTTTTTSTSTTSKTTTTTSSTSSTSTTSRSTTTTTTSSASSTPTQPTQVDSFSFLGCYSDQESPRVLVADSKEDATGMTVEACVSLAKAGAWRYAGVEYSRQCFVGNTIHDGTAYSDSDCNMLCSGNAGETCGGGNRVQIYADRTWEDPTYAELADAIHQYNASVWQALQVLESYQNHLETLQGLLQSSSAKVKRADQSEYEQIELQMMGDQSDANEASSSLSAAKSNGDRLLTLGRRLDTIDEDDPRVSEDAFEEWDNAVDALQSQMIEVIRDINANLVELSDAIAAGLAPAIDAAASISQLRITINAIGLPVSAAASATGIFLVLATLAALFESNGSPPVATPTIMPTTTTMMTTATSTTSSSTSSTSCAATATTSPVIIMTVEGTTVQEFQDFVATLPKDPEALQFTESWQPNFVYMGIVDQCTAEMFNSNPIVDAWSVDGEIDLDSNDDTLDDAVSAKKRSYSATPAGSWHPGSTNNPLDEPWLKNDNLNATERQPHLQARIEPTANSRFYLQQQSPGHLQWLSQVSRYSNLYGNYLSFDDLLYNDPSNANANGAPIVYVIDSAFLAGHESFADRLYDSFGVDDVGTRKTGLTIVPRNGHGTCMASLATGAYHSMGKTARLVAVELVISKSGVILEMRARRAAFVFHEIYRHIVNNGAQGNAVISMSFGGPRQAFLWGGSLNPLDEPYRDVFDKYLQWFYDLGVAVICSAGNDATQQREPAQLDLNYLYPRGKGGADTPLIVVGNALFDNSRNPTSQSRDEEQRGILTLYNIGTNVDCATVGYNDQGVDTSQLNVYAVEPAGTSQATAITAGMVAYYLSQPDLRTQFMANGLGSMSQAIKTYLLNTANQYKLDAGLTDGIPRAALGDVVPCTGGTAGRPVINPNPFVPAATDGRQLVRTQVTDGTTVVIQNVPQCWDLN